VNWFLMILSSHHAAVQKSENLAAAYGLAVAGTMTITDIMMVMIFSKTTKQWKCRLLSGHPARFCLLIANLNKLPMAAAGRSLSLQSLATILVWTWPGSPVQGA
jgi:KUP system potassium uptake protein